MKIKEFYSSGIKENGKIDISFECDNKQFQFLNCEFCVDKNYNTRDCNLTFKYKYDYYELD